MARTTVDADGTVGPGTVLARTQPPAVEHVEIDGEAVVYDTDRDSVHLLDTTATLVWLCLDGRASLHEIAADVAVAFDLELERALSDVIGFAGELREIGLAVDAR